MDSGLLFRSSKLKEKNKNITKTVMLTRLIDMLLFMNFNVSSFGLYLKKKHCTPCSKWNIGGISWIKRPMGHIAHIRYVLMAGQFFMV